MSRINREKQLPVGGWSRRDFLRAGVAGLAGVSLPALGAPAAFAAAEPPRAKRCIFIVCTGAPSQLETWDPKPDAPAEVRGPFGAIETNVPGIRISELLPRLARHADKYALVRSLHSDAPAIHEVGMQQIQTGGWSLDNAARPHVGTLASRTSAGTGVLPGHMVLPRRLAHLGLDVPTSQEALTASRIETVALARETEALSREPVALQARYGAAAFGESCRLARRLIERGARFVTVNQFDSVFHRATWDTHGLPDLPTRVGDLQDAVAPGFDQAVSALFEDLHDRGLLEETLVCCFGEFGRTPRMTSTGGRDHSSRCWSVMLGGGGIRGGQVIGASDRHAAEPVERPVTPAMLAATVLAAMGCEFEGAAPIRELL